ncbi:MAG: SufD family Fe-S cluster assembly protein [Firmicutes bacterium]|nr:SufD family Fe-S cluster assembly protein [Bacillota bacterium]
MNTAQIIVDNESVKLKINENKTHLKCFNKNKIIIDKEQLDLEITLEDNSSLELIWLNKKIKNSNIIINQNHNTNLIYKQAFLNEEDLKLNIINNIIGNNNKSEIVIRTISLKNKIDINILASNEKNSKNNEIIEDIKALNFSGLVTIEPNIKINSLDVIANHYVTIGQINKDELFYLMSYGLDEKKAKELILNSFLKIDGGEIDE